MSNFNLPAMPKFPEFTKTKSGYEIRAEILDMAKGFVVDDYHAKYHGWEVSVEKDAKTGQVISTVGMPQFPGMDQILETAEKFYGFVNKSVK